MRKLVVGTFATLDGVMQAPGGPNEDRDGGFEHGGWLVPYFDAKFGEIMTVWTKRAGAFLLGRKTYEIFAESWSKSTDPADENATALNTRPKSSHPGRSIRSAGTTPSCSRATLPRRLRSSRHRKAASFRFTAAATSFKPYCSTTLSIRYVFGSFLLFSVPVSVCSAEARSRAVFAFSTRS